MCGKKRGKRLIYFLQSHEIVVKIYLSFAFVLTLTGVLTGVIFIELYQKNYINSYTNLLTNQGKSIAKRVSKFEYNNRVNRFQKYSVYISEIESAEQTDVWILRNPKAENPLAEEYTNAELDDDILTPEMESVLEQAYIGNITSNTSYDRVYGMTTLRVGIPICDKESKEIIGAIMMVSMIDRQTMGLDKGKHLIVISVFLSFVISYVVALGFSKALSNPLSKLGYYIRKIGAGDYTKINPKRPNSQFGRIETRLDILAEKLSQAEKERENLEQVRRDFFANVSHELRTPITVMRGYTETLNDGVITDKATIEEMYTRMLSECQGMERLVGDLFILSKMQNPDFEIEKEPVSLLQIFHDIIRGARMLGEEKQIQFQLICSQEEPYMMLGDYVRLRQMFMVIIDNAVKFSYEGGTIEIQLEKKQERLYVQIRDYGVGIAEKELPYIFEKFYKSKMRQNARGTGLGLMIAKQIALRHDGQIKVESEEGKGSTFFFQFAECTSMEEYE